VLSIEDYLKERIEKDAGRTARDMLYRVRRDKSLRRMPSGALNPYVDSLLLGSNLAQPLEETNPLQLYEQHMRLTRFGEGGVGSPELVTADARDVNPGQLGFIDPIAGPESERIGTDTRIAYRTFKGRDQQLYGEFMNAQNGSIEYIRPEDLDNKVIAFPGQDPKAKQLYGIKDGKIDQYPAKEVDFHVPTQSHMYAHGVNLTPMPTSFMPSRAFYASKYHSQWLPLVKGEAPLVQTQVPGQDIGFPTHYGRRVGALSSPVAGIVTKVTPNGVKIKTEDGDTKFIETVRDFPFNRMTAVSYYPAVQEGDVVNAGDMVAHSNFTTKDGSLAMGVNLRTAVVPYKGHSFEDAYVISESAAAKLATERLYGFDTENKYGTEISRNKYVSLFPKKYGNEQLQKMDDNGVVRAGQTVNQGDPIILAVGPRTLSAEDAELGRLHKALRNSHKDQSTTWDHPEPGIVTDVGYTKSGVKVNIKTQSHAQEGDKLANMEASKGVIGKILPDDQMPVNAATGEPYEMLFNPMAVLSRSAPNQLVELQLAKIARLTGKPVIMPSVPPKEGWQAYTQKLLKEHGLEAKADMLDVESGKTIRSVSDGVMYISPFHHLAEKKLCVSADTEVLTRRGWLPAPDVRMTDELATLNPETGETEWRRPSMVRRYEHHGLLYNITDYDRDELVNKDHKLWLEGRFVPVHEFIDERRLADAL
jgi:DNA-directed RNA polymerase subunit beta